MPWIGGTLVAFSFSASYASLVGRAGWPHVPRSAERGSRRPPSLCTVGSASQSLGCAVVVTLGGRYVEVKGGDS